MQTEALFDVDVELERRLAQLVGWIEGRRGEPVGKAEQVLLAYLLGARAAALPLHAIYPNEPAMDVTLLNPHHSDPADPVVDEVLVSAFIGRHTHLTPEQIDGLQEAEHRYQAIIGVTDWDAAFETRAAFDSAVATYEVIARQSEQGRPLHEDDVFWYVAARDGGFSREDADTYSRFSLMYLYLLGLVTDDVGTLELAA